jgi:hypothetical protein
MTSLKNIEPLPKCGMKDNIAAIQNVQFLSHLGVLTDELL